MTENWFDGDVAATYDEESAERFDPVLLAATTDFLARLAGGRPALELAIGTAGSPYHWRSEASGCRASSCRPP